MAINITAKQAIDAHLGSIIETPSYTLFSGFMAALRDARKFTKRNQDTGEKLLEDSFGDHGSWLGAIGYLVLLDQIGTCFKPKAVSHLDGPSITRALRYFGRAGVLEADAIYALRCSLAHDFCTLNINVKKPSLTHLFTVYQDNVHPVVTFPKVRWDGNMLNLTHDNVTFVNLEALGDIVEYIYQRLLNLASNGNLEIILPGGAEALAIKYSFWTPKNES